MKNFKNTSEIEGLDIGIEKAVNIMIKNGFQTFESCQGGIGHCFNEPTIRFFGDEFDLIRAWEVCELNGLRVFEAKRVFRKVDMYDIDLKLKGLSWDKPFNEIVFK